MNTVIQQKLDKVGELTRTDIAEVLESIAKPGSMRQEKKDAIKKLCEDKNTGLGMGGHGVWETLADFPQW